MKTRDFLILGIILGAIVSCSAIYFYDVGRRSVLEDCREFQTFTYGRTAWLCQSLRTARQAEQEQKEEHVARTEL